MQRRWTIELAIMVFEELRILAKRWECRSPEFWGFWLFGDISRRCTDMVLHHPRLKMYIHWGTGPKKVYILGPFGRDCIPHPASYILNFWWPPPTSYIFNLLYEMRGDLPLYIMFGEASKSPQKVARQKKIDKFQTQSLSYILSCLVGCLGDQLNTIKYCMILMILQYSILHDLEVPNTYNDSLALTHKHP